MSTHAEIGIMHGDKCKSIYLHSDGYLEYAGRVLLNHYDSTKAQFLVAQGDCSALGMDIGEKVNFGDRLGWSDEHNASTQCRFYKRDRDESGVDFKVSFSIGELLGKVDAHYVYIMKDGVWYVSLGGGPLEVLSDVLAKEKVNA
jgi:hypothetical protein